MKIEFLVAGGYPGDGQPKPIRFPDPAEVGTLIDGVRVVELTRALVELKLASGTAAHRIKDLGDVQQLIQVLNLPVEFGDRLDDSVRDRYRELWTAVRSAPSDE